MKYKKEKNNISTHLQLVVFFVILSLWSVCAFAEGLAKLTPLKVDSVADVKMLVNLKVVGKRLCVTYESPKRWGTQLLRVYRIDESSGLLMFETEYFRNPAKSNGIDYPVLFQDSLGATYVMDCTYPLVYNIDLEKHVMQNTHKFVFTDKAKVPYPMALNVSFAYRSSELEYYFVGRQPKRGVQAVYKSKSDTTSVFVEEIAQLVFSKKYPAWTTNFGKQTVGVMQHVIAHGFYLYPAIQYVNLDTKQSYVVKLAEPNWKRLKPLTADVWEENIVQIKDISSSKNYVYALWWNKSLQNMETLRKQNKAACKIVTLDWDGDVKKIYYINRYMVSIVALDDGKLIGTDGKKYWLITLE